MDELQSIALWFVATPSPEEEYRFRKIAGVIGEIGNVGKQMLGHAAPVAALGVGGVAAKASFNTNKALFNPQVQQARNNFGAANGF